MSSGDQAAEAETCPKMGPERVSEEAATSYGEICTTSTPPHHADRQKPLVEWVESWKPLSSENDGNPHYRFSFARNVVLAVSIVIKDVTYSDMPPT